MKRLLVVVGVPAVFGAVTGVGLLVAFPKQLSKGKIRARPFWLSFRSSFLCIVAEAHLPTLHAPPAAPGGGNKQRARPR
jgi:hypothetical protein